MKEKHKMNKTVYVPMCCDIVHHGHINILREAAQLGEVVVGLLTDEAMANYKRLPIYPYAERKKIVEQIRMVEKVIPQNSADFEANLTALRPDYFVHGTDWRMGKLEKLRGKTIKLMAEWGGKVVEIEYTEGVSSTNLSRKVLDSGLMPEQRLKYFRRLLAAKKYLRVIEAHSGLSAKVGGIACYTSSSGEERTFDALWLSSLTASSLKWKPDIEFVDLSSRISIVNDILEASTMPIIYDGDTGGGGFSIFL